MKEILIALHAAALQIEYLHWKFQETGSGNSTLAQLEHTIKLAETLAREAKAEEESHTQCQ
jgi:hypothetical protein